MLHKKAFTLYASSSHSGIMHTIRHACHNNVNVFFAIYLLSALVLSRSSSSLLLLQRLASTKQQAAAYFALIICSTMRETVREQAAYCSFYRLAPDCGSMRASVSVLVLVCVCGVFSWKFLGPGDLSVPVAQNDMNAKNTKKCFTYRAATTAQKAARSRRTNTLRN